MRELPSHLLLCFCTRLFFRSAHAGKSLTLNQEREAMLLRRNLGLLYLGASVLALVDELHHSHFWMQVRLPPQCPLLLLCMQPTV